MNPKGPQRAREARHLTGRRAKRVNALAWVEKEGIVLMAGKGPVPSLTEKIAGEPIKGSWWGHPKGRAIFAAASEVAESADVLACKLIDGKVTFVHRRLWPALVALAGEIGRDRLARVDQEHTDSGKHVNKVTPYPAWVPADVKKAARSVDLNEARASLAAVLAKARRGSKRR